MLVFQNFMAQHSQLYLILIVKTVVCQEHTIITEIAQITAVYGYVANACVIQSIQSSFRGRHFVVSLSRAPASLWQKNVLLLALGLRVSDSLFTFPQRSLKFSFPCCSTGLSWSSIRFRKGFLSISAPFNTLHLNYVVITNAPLTCDPSNRLDTPGTLAAGTIFGQIRALGHLQNMWLSNLFDFESMSRPHRHMCLYSRMQLLSLVSSSCLPV